MHFPVMKKQWKNSTPKTFVAEAERTEGTNYNTTECNSRPVIENWIYLKYFEVVKFTRRWKKIH